MMQPKHNYSEVKQKLSVKLPHKCEELPHKCEVTISSDHHLKCAYATH